tara:strand:- start:59 stop:487 length:429 start_codon:yes stop_codon:yes gene_type:complete
MEGNKYSKGKIYNIIDKSNGDVYVGSTTLTLKERWKSHQMLVLYDKKREDCEIILIEDYPCETKRQLQQREQYYMDHTKCINKYRAYGRNLEQMKLYEIQYRNNHLSKAKEYKKERCAYQYTWGGDKRCSNNLLAIDVDIFT